MGLLVSQIVFTEPSEAAAAGLLHSGPTSGIVCDPGPVGLWHLEAILTRRAYDEVAQAQPDPVAIFNGGQRFVLPLTTALRDRLAALRGWRALVAALAWARTDEVRAERLSRQDAHKLLYHLHLVASEAERLETLLYLWVDVDERAMFG